MENTKELTTVSPTTLLQLAIQKGVDVVQLEKLIELQERYQKSIAEKEFNIAMANFQKNCPVIKKEKTVKGKDGVKRYSYASIGEIISQIKKPLGENNLFYDFITEDEKEFLKVTCTITHERGHSKNTSFKVPIGKEDYMTDVQKYGARVTFAKRYALCNALGITTAEEDIDAINTGKEKDKKIEIPQIVIDELILMTTVKELDKYCLEHCKPYLKSVAFQDLIIPMRKRMFAKEFPNKKYSAHI